MLILWDITFFHNTVMPPLFLRMKIFEAGIFCNTARFPYNFFSALWDNKLFNAEKWYVFFLHKIFRYPKYFKTLEGSPRIHFRIVRQNKIIGVWWKPLLLHEIFRYPKFSETLEGSPTNVLALWVKENSTEKREIRHFSSIIFVS